MQHTRWMNIIEHIETMILLFGTLLFSILFLVVIIGTLLHRIRINDVTKRTVFITGCDTGFGNLLARALDSRGVNVIAGCLTETGASKLQEVTSCRLKTTILDITDTKSVNKAYQFVKDNGELWGLVNNAGVMPNYAPIEWTSLEEFEKVSKVNLFGTISVTLTFLPLLRKARGRLVTVCSVSSSMALPGVANYVVSKAAVKTFIDCIRRELLNTGVTAHTIEPGGFETGITNKDRLTDVFKAAYQKSSHELQEWYGGRIASYILDGIKLSGKIKFFRNDPQMVADAMQHALLAKFPKRRYLVGPDANYLFRPLMCLPEWFCDYILSWPRPFGQKPPELHGL